MSRDPLAPIIVLKFGGSVLTAAERVHDAVHECYRWVRAGHRVVAVVSAVGDTTDRLLADADRYGIDASPQARAALVALGERTSAAHLRLALDRAGVPATSLEPERLGLVVEGSPLDAVPVRVDPAPLRAALAEASVVVVPGFVGCDRAGRLALLGRGGSDCSAIALADALDARCRLLKDVPGLYERDPSRPGPFARRFAEATFADARRLAGSILQRAAVEHAIARGRRFEVAALGLDEATLVGAATTRFAPTPSRRALRVALLGFGVVGAGVGRHLLADRERFELVGVAVRHPKRHADAIPPHLLRGSAADLVEDPSIDAIVECIGGIDPAGALVERALVRGAEVVTANKSLLALRGPALAALARASGGRLRSSAAAGGAAPFLERIERLAGERGVASIEAILNGTTNAILDRVAAGVPFGDALAEAQARGYAESDPSADLDGRDAAEKLTLLARAAFGAEPRAMRVVGIRATTSAADARGVRLVARATPSDASVAPERLDDGHPLASVTGAANRLVATTLDGERVVVDGLGAGRWPTAEAVLADLLDAWRACSVPRPARRPLRREVCA